MEADFLEVPVSRSDIFKEDVRPRIFLGEWSHPKAFGEHRHEGRWELVYIKKGTLRHRINGQDFAQGRGDFSLLRECDKHCGENIDAEWSNIGISPKYYQYLKGPSPEGGTLLAKTLEGKDAIIGHIPAEAIDDFEKRLEKMFFLQGTEYETAFFCALFFEMMSYVKRSDAHPLPMGTPKWLSDCLAYFGRSVREPVSIETLVKGCGRSQAHITRCFKKYLSITPSVYVNAKRITQAEKMLLNSDLTIKEITAAIGYSNKAYFFCIFRKKHGMTPLAYRRQNSASRQDAYANLT